VDHLPWAYIRQPGYCRRTTRRRGAGQLVQAIVGERGTAGGHGSMAGATSPSTGEDAEALRLHLSQQVLAYFQMAPETAGQASFERASEVTMTPLQSFYTDALFRWPT